MDNGPLFLRNFVKPSVLKDLRLFTILKDFLCKKLWYDDDPEGQKIPSWMKNIRLRSHDAVAEDAPWTDQ